MPSSFKVIIIGSGLAGSLLANGLIRNDIEVAVYERLAEDAKREGYQIRLGAPALEGFRACLSQSQIDALVQKFGRANGVKTGAPVCYDQHFKELLNLAALPSYSKSAPINRHILRSALAEPVTKAGKLQYSKSFKRYEILNPNTSLERVRVYFEDGDFDECDLLIAADGSHSKINSQVGLNNIQQITSHVTVVAKSELPTSKYLAMTPELSRSPVMTFSSNKALYFCAYLPDKLDETNETKSESLQIDEELSSSMFGVALPIDICPPDLLDRTRKQKWDFVSSAFGDWSKEYHETIDLVKDSDIYMYKPRVGTRPSNGWRQSVKSSEVPELGHPRVWLMGDAVHPMLPSRGMGGNQSMRDCATIMPLLLDLAHSARAGEACTSDEIGRACKIYEAEMLPRSFAWVQKSGGLKPVPLDANSWLGSMFFYAASLVTKVVYTWYYVTSMGNIKHVDDAPEFRS